MKSKPIKEELYKRHYFDSYKQALYALYVFIQRESLGLKDIMPVGKIPNIVIVFETLHTSLGGDVNKALETVSETWGETKETLNNFRIATKDALRVRGEPARKIEEAEIWKQKYEKELQEKERMLEELVELKSEVNKLREDKKTKNESILSRNTNLVKQLQEEQRSRLNLLDEILEDKSLLNHMKVQQRRAMLQEMRQKTFQDYEKLVDETNKKKNPRSKSLDSANKKASFV